MGNHGGRVLNGQWLAWSQYHHHPRPISVNTSRVNPTRAEDPRPGVDSRRLKAWMSASSSSSVNKGLCETGGGGRMAVLR